jgi:predicted transposase YbfD/YdcC
MKAKIYKVKPYTNEIIRGKFSKIKDMRVAGMVEHPLVDLLIIIMLGVICGLEKCEQIQRYAVKKQVFLRQVFGIEKQPSKSTLERTLDMVNGEEIAEVIIEIMKMKILKLGDIIAVDGKSIRSTVPAGKKNAALQILTAYFVESGVVLGQKYISDKDKTNEIPVFQELLCLINIKGKTITGDAMHCQKDTCSMIIAKGGNYVFGLKGNHKLLRNDVAKFFDDPKNADKIEVFEPRIEKRGGRVEQRIFHRALDVMQFEGVENWMGIKSIFAVRRIVASKNGTTDETSYYISSLDSSPDILLKTVRDHWKIESMHWLLDVVFSEDDHVNSSVNAHKTLNILRKFALLLHKTYIQEHNLKISLKNSMLDCLMDDDLILRLCS